MGMEMLDGLSASDAVSLRSLRRKGIRDMVGF